MANESQNLGSESHCVRGNRDYMDGFNLSRLLSKTEADLLSKFIDSHRDQLTLPPTNLSPFLWPLIYLNLDSLLSLLQNNPVLAIIDFFSYDVIEKIENLRDYGFGGSWFDSLESLIADNVQYDHEHLEKLKDKERELKRASHVNS